MAKKNKAPIIGIGRDPENKLLVQKSNPMTILARSELSLAELKILDMYLARIDTHKPEQRTVKLTKGQLEEALGVTQIKKDDLKQRLKNLYQPIDLAKDDKKRLHLISLFEEAEAEQDENGVWQVTLTCTQSAMKYMFCIEDYGYFKYKLSSVVSMKSRYSMILFLYLEKNRFRTPWEESLVVLKHELNCDQDELYNEFKMFNQRILKKCQKEIQAITDTRFTYEPIRKGRSVTAIRFTLETFADLLPEVSEDNIPKQKTDTLPGQISFEDFPAADENETMFTETLDFLNGACDNEFSEEEMEVIFNILVNKTLPENKDGVEIARYHYLAQKYAEFKARAAKKAEVNDPIKKRFNYFKVMLEKDGTGR